MALLRTFMAHHGHPQGLLGKVVAFRLSRANREANEWAVDLLELKPADRVLEIGFGPGLAIHKIASLVPQGFVAGIDSSAVMFRIAARRNADAIAAGRVELKQGSMAALPYGDNEFDKALAVQVINYLSDPVAKLREWHRVMGPHGRVLLFFEGPEKFERTKKALEGIYRPYAARDVMHMLQQAGFGRVWYKTRWWWYGEGICVLGEKPLF